MKTGIDKLKWRGRKYLGGLIHGLAIGVLIGIFLCTKYSPYFKKNFAWFAIIFISINSVMLLGHIVLGKPIKEIKQNK